MLAFKKVNANFLKFNKDTQPSEYLGRLFHLGSMSFIAKETIVTDLSFSFTNDIDTTKLTFYSSIINECHSKNKKFGTKTLKESQPFLFKPIPFALSCFYFLFMLHITIFNKKIRARHNNSYVRKNS